MNFKEVIKFKCSCEWDKIEMEAVFSRSENQDTEHTEKTS